MDFVDFEIGLNKFFEIVTGVGPAEVRGFIGTGSNNLILNNGLLKRILLNVLHKIIVTFNHFRELGFTYE